MTIEIMADAAPRATPPQGGIAAMDRSLRRMLARGVLVVLIFGLALGAWSTLATLVGAVVASGQFVVAGDVKKVQHMTGGVVGGLLVREGSHVEAGQTLLRLDPTIIKANRDIVAKQLDEAAVSEARLTAERDGRTTFDVPARLSARMDDPAVAQMVAAERRLLEDRASALQGREAQLQKRIEQAGDEVAGLKAQLESKKTESGVLRDEIETVRDLYANKLVQYSRLSTILREGARVDGEIGQLISNIAATEGKISEIRLQIIQLGVDQREASTKELREIQARDGEFSERLVAAEDELRRIDLRAPVAGTVYQLAVHTVGGVLRPGETAMSIVPSNASLELEVHIPPTDVDQVTAGQRARVKLRAGNQRTTPDIYGQVIRVGADAGRDERTGASFYSVRIGLPEDEVKKVEPLRIIAGMQAEVFIETGERTPLDFLMKPLTEQIARTFTER